jgi:hypothetical protein
MDLSRGLGDVYKRQGLGSDVRVRPAPALSRVILKADPEHVMLRPVIDPCDAKGFTLWRFYGQRWI